MEPQKIRERSVRPILVASGGVLGQKNILSSINLYKDGPGQIHKKVDGKSLNTLLDIRTRLQRGLCGSTLVTVNISNVLFWPE